MESPLFRRAMVYRISDNGARRAAAVLGYDRKHELNAVSTRGPINLAYEPRHHGLVLAEHP